MCIQIMTLLNNQIFATKPLQRFYHLTVPKNLFAKRELGMSPSAFSH